MKINWLRAATLAIAASAGLPLAASAQNPNFHISDAVVDPSVAAPVEASLSDASVSDEADYAIPARASHSRASYSSSGYSSASYASGNFASANYASASASGEPCQACAEEAAAEETECEPWRLFCQKDCGVNVYGWLAGGIMGNSQSPASGFNGPTTFPDQWWGQGNQAYAIAEKTIDTEGCGCDWGGRVDFLYGSDYIYTMATGLELRETGAPKWNSNPDYGLALPQAYVELGYNDVSLKVGHFYTPIGYEVVPATGNFFYSHAYTMQYGEPFTHSGGIATWKMSDELTLLGAYVNGWDALDRVDDEGMGIAGFTWNNGDNLTVAYNYGYSVDEFTVDGRLTPRHISSLVVTYTQCDWTYVFQNDVGWQQDGVFNDSTEGDPFQTAEWYGINQYLFYTINDCWKAGARVEWFRDDDGVRVGGIRPGQTIPTSGFAGNFYNLTAGLNWTPHANITVRPEIRYDWYDGLSAPGGVEPFDDGTRTDQFLYGVDLIVLW
jgi:putative OmpL-like beta-barrel porin-2